MHLAQAGRLMVVMMVMVMIAIVAAGGTTVPRIGPSIAAISIASSVVRSSVVVSGPVVSAAPEAVVTVVGTGVGTAVVGASRPATVVGRITVVDVVIARSSSAARFDGLLVGRQFPCRPVALLLWLRLVRLLMMIGDHHLCLFLFLTGCVTIDSDVGH